MKYSVIDIGSNSIRLTVYKVKNGSFKILFKEKHILGLAGYVEGGCLTEEGISRAVSGIRDFRNTLTALGITERIFVFATASLRNVINTYEAASKIADATGLEIDVITGEEEAMLGYTGAMQQLDISEGAFVDIGGASTEIALFRGGAVEKVKSYRAGSLKLYKV